VTVNGTKQPLLGTGAWNKPFINMESFTSALSAVHTGLGYTNHRSVIQSQYYLSTKTFILGHHVDTHPPLIYQLRPSELRRIGDHCISSGSTFQVSIFICLLFAVDLFLHKEEFLGVDFDSFINHLMIMSGEYLVDGLVVKLKKKRTGSIEEKAGKFGVATVPVKHTNEVHIHSSQTWRPQFWPALRYHLG
jgi:hypothetical protein